MVILNPYLNFDGNTEEAFNFYKSVFGGEFTMLQRFKDTPQKDKLSKSDGEKIMHVSIPIGKGNVLMGTDAVESMGHKITIGNNIQLSLSPESEDEANRLFNALAKGGRTIVPMGKASWGDYFGMLTDKFGIQWMINYSEPKKKDQSKEKELSHH
jgi:PhnB protein